jgi:chromosome partitioning protein
MTASTLAYADVLLDERAGRLAEVLARIKAEGPFRKVYAVVNQKGGVGKTTTVVTLAAVLARWGLRVRIIDADPQAGSATFWLPPVGGPLPDLRDVYFDEATLDQATYPTTVPGVYIVPSTKTLGQVEFAGLADANLAMASAIDQSEPFDVTLLDCRPSLGVLTVSQLVAGKDGLIVPLSASGMDVPGLVELSETIGTVKRRLNKGLRVAVVVVCDDADTRVSKDTKKQLLVDYPHALHWRIRHSVRVQEAPFEHQPLTVFCPDSPPTHEYIKLGAELLLKEVAR